MPRHVSYFGDTGFVRASRLLSVLMLLQSRGRMSAQALAAELEVSVRTVYRDVDELSAAGVPVWADRGRLGGFQLQPGWRSRVDGLTAPEAQALFLGGLPGPAAELGLGEAMASAQLKLLAALPDGWREDARRVGSRFHLDPIDWYRGPAATDHLPAIAQAVWSERRIAVRYESWKGVTRRRLEPLGLVLKAGVWYMAAGSGKEPPRTYRLSNILELVVSEERFARPKDFDLVAYWLASTRRFERELYRDSAVLRVSPLGMKRLRGLSTAVADAADKAAGDVDTWGWRRVTIPIESVDHAAGQMLRLGPEAQVLRPAALRKKLVETIAAMAVLYDA
ncbi:helix-turn-helix transcriptional regulator [Piscinibacter sp.]|jgi:predicted DNA-binding transcriptional regulator YafY|uniref:helix-turn-helix transcriptional regulator n=1 Tax=Piscinibacter sp. TaxID=1903157 RepID=UPI002F402494